MQLIGQLNGEEVKFDYFPPDKFITHVPKQTNGSYSLFLRCIDNSGNETGLAGIYICIDFQKMSFKILEKIYSKKVNDSYKFREINNKYSYEVVT